MEALAIHLLKGFDLWAFLNSNIFPPFTFIGLLSLTRRRRNTKWKFGSKSASFQVFVGFILFKYDSVLLPHSTKRQRTSKPPNYLVFVLSHKKEPKLIIVFRWLGLIFTSTEMLYCIYAFTVISSAEAFFGKHRYKWQNWTVCFLSILYVADEILFLVPMDGKIIDNKEGFSSNSAIDSTRMVWKMIKGTCSY